MDAKKVLIDPQANPAGIESAENIEQAIVQLSEIVSGLSGGGSGPETDPIYTADKPNIALKSEVTPKADTNYVNAQDAGLQAQIDAIGTFVETDPYYNADKPNIALKSEVTPKADTTYVNAQDAVLQSQITTLSTDKANKTYVDTQDAALQSAINSTNTTLASKADTSYVNTQDAALQQQIDSLNAFVETDPVYTADKPNIALKSEVLLKADKTYVDTQDSALQAQIDAISTTFAKVVYVNAATPATATIFSLENPPTVNDPALAADPNNLYVGTDFSTWTYSAGTYNTKVIAPTTEFFLAGTTTDAGSNKTSTIQRNGAVQVGTGLSPSTLNSFEVGPQSGSTTAAAAFRHTLANGRAILSVQNTSNSAGFDLRAYGAGFSETWWGANLAGKSAMFAFSDMYMGTIGAQSLFFGTNNTNRMVITNDGAVRITNAVFSNTTSNVSGPNGLGPAPTGGVAWQTGGGAWAWLIQNTNANGHGADFNVSNTAASGYAFSVRVGGVSAVYVDGLRRTNFSGLIQQLTSQAIYLGVNNFSTDTVGDTRLRTVSGSIIIETCTVANAGKGLGTWVAQPSTSSLKNQSFTATAGQTVFTLTSTPSGAVLGYRNNVLLNSNAFTISGTTATYVPANNGNNALLAGDVIRFVYN